MASIPAISAALGEALRAYDRARAVRLAHQALDDGTLTILDLYEHLAAVLVEVGAAWRESTTEVWQEHLLTGIVRTVVESCALRVDDAAPPQRSRSVVLAAPAEEYHDLGLRMLADRFALAGWRPRFLGAAVPVEEVLAAVRALEADAAALSASTHFHRVRLRAYVDALTAAVPALQVWVGGPAFAHGHDGWDAALVLDPRAIPAAGDR